MVRRASGLRHPGRIRRPLPGFALDRAVGAVPARNDKACRQAGCAQRNYFRPKTGVFANPARLTLMFHAKTIDLYDYFDVAFF
jgi:hypothetical protein